jgi:hypothetical protein
MRSPSIRLSLSGFMPLVAVLGCAQPTGTTAFAPEEAGPAADVDAGTCPNSAELAYGMAPCAVEGSQCFGGWECTGYYVATCVGGFWKETDAIDTTGCPSALATGVGGDTDDGGSDATADAAAPTDSSSSDSSPSLGIDAPADSPGE